jgi:Holliday junction resolvase-like predicted endonuclease
MDHRRDLGRLGEEIAARVLADRGAVVLERNVQVGPGEVDLVVAWGGRRAIVEVRTVRGRLRVDERFPYAKRRQVHALATSLGIRRVDLVGVAVLPDRVDVHWLRNVAPD